MGGPGDHKTNGETNYLPPSALTCCALPSIDDGIESIGIDLSHFNASFGSFDVVSSENGNLIRLGSSLSMPLAAARPLRSALRTIQV